MIKFRCFKKMMAVPVMVLCALFLVSCSKEPEPQGEIVRPVKTFTVSSDSVVSRVEMPGKISAIRHADMAFDVPGKLIELPVYEGQIVEEGQLLARLDERDYQSALDVQTAQLASAEAEYKRAQTLFDDGTISRRDFDLAKSSFEVAQAQVKTARKALNETRLVAPFSGRVARVMKNNFESVDAKKTVMIVQDCSRLEIKINVPEKDFVRKRLNDAKDVITARYNPCVVLSSLPDRKIPAVITEAAMTADPITRTFEVTMVFEAPKDVSILPGMTAKIIADDPGEDDIAGLGVPVNAVLSDAQGAAFVWVLGHDMTVSPQPVETGIMSGDIIRITKGLSGGEEIVISGVHKLRAGMKVRRFDAQKN